MIVEHHRRGIRVKALPIGIPYDRFEMLARTAPKVFCDDGVKVISVLEVKKIKNQLLSLKYGPNLASAWFIFALFQTN